MALWESKSVRRERERQEYIASADAEADKFWRQGLRSAVAVQIEAQPKDEGEWQAITNARFFGLANLQQAKIEDDPGIFQRFLSGDRNKR